MTRFDKMHILKAEWLITRNCDLKCSYCKIRDCSTLGGRPELTTYQLVDVLKMFSQLWPGAPMIVYGGEPTTRDDLPMLLSAGKKYGVKLPVISNSVRVMRDAGYRKKLVDAGLENWSVSFDGLTEDAVVDNASLVKSRRGLQSLLVFRDAYGLRDLVTCITVTKFNIRRLPEYLRFLTKQGIHAIFTPLHVGGEQYEYGQGDPDHLPSQEDILSVSGELSEMVSSNEYLCSNDPEWFDSWPGHFLKQDWMCNDKCLLTIDADGSLRYCVDIPFRDEDRMFAWELKKEEGQQKFLRIIKKGPPCNGCLWNPAYECIRRARCSSIGDDEGRRRSRHEVPKGRLRSLYGEAGRWFGENPTLKPTIPRMKDSDAVKKYSHFNTGKWSLK